MCAQSTQVCQYCSREVNSTSNRLIQELCGHNKCRRCFIQEKNGCEVCLEDSRRVVAFPRVSSAPCKMKTAWAKMTEAEIEEDQKSLDSEALQIDTDVEGVEEEVPQVQEKLPVKKRVKFSLPGHVKRLEDGRFECSICERKFSSRQQCVYHSYCDSSIKKPHECPHCDQEFITMNHLQYHLESHEENILKCSLCSKQFLRSQSLQKHLKIHRAEHENKCSRCDATFPFRFQLKQHELKHENIRPHQCSLCPRAFALKENLKKHLLVHTKEKRFSCEACGRKFSRSTTLKAHKNTHSKKRLFGPCSSCGKTFVDARSFARHSLSHSSTLSFTCSLCNAMFKRKDNLRRHVRIIHPEENLQDTLEDSTKEEPPKAAVNPPPGRTCSVIKFTGNPPAEEERPRVPEEPPKSKKPFDPLEIYRKILCPSRDDEDEEVPVARATKSPEENIFVHWRKRTSLNFTQNSRRKD